MTLVFTEPSLSPLSDMDSLSCFRAASGRTWCLERTAPGVTFHGCCCGLQTGDGILDLLAAIKVHSCHCHQKNLQDRILWSPVKCTENTWTYSEKEEGKCGQPLKDFLPFVFILEEWSQPCVLKRINVSALIQARYSFQKILLPITVSEKTKGFIGSVQASTCTEVDAAVMNFNK